MCDKDTNVHNKTDCISREAAILEFCDDCMDKEWCKSNGESCSRIKNINAVPAADVRPVVHGKWRLYSPLTDTYECDKCGYQVIDESFRTNFCPDCGADMRGPNLDATKGDNHD